MRTNFGHDDRIKFDEIDRNNVVWHHSIAERQAYDGSFNPSNLAVICNIRRLPHWLLSRIHYERTRSPHLIVTGEMFLAGRFFQPSGKTIDADYLARKYSAYPVTHWIRVEHFESDFRRAFTSHLDLMDNVSFGRKNSTTVDYIKAPEFYFAAPELRALYESNPVWAGIEIEVYGDLLGTQT